MACGGSSQGWLWDFTLFSVLVWDLQRWDQVHRLTELEGTGGVPGDVAQLTRHYAAG